MDFYPEGVLYETQENTSYISKLSGLMEAFRTGTVVEQKPVMSTSAHELVFSFGKTVAVMAREECEYVPEGRIIKDIAVISRVNKPTCFIVTDIDLSGPEPRISISRREAQKRFIEYAKEHISPGDVIGAKVTHLEPFGAFVDIGCGVVSLIPTESISVSRISHPSDRFERGQNILVAVKGIEAKSGRFFITHKELLGTWEQNAANFSAGQTVIGVIRSIEAYGVFVELAPNLVGLCEYRPDAVINQLAAVYIKSIIPEKMKIKLSIVELFMQKDAPHPIDYYVLDHIDHWRYTPKDHTKKVIEERFGD
ncbi:MAG: S1 RNA-binding domain-containing protein [Clostridia bacterium]|nr:S1 RNA-binding domain-containing protein [Clostridia bacterium]